MARTSKTLQKEKAKKKESQANNEARIQEALKAFAQGLFTNITAAARHYNVSCSTVHRRLKKSSKPRSKAHAG
jgi:hypothetical protein